MPVLAFEECSKSIRAKLERLLSQAVMGFVWFVGKRRGGGVGAFLVVFHLVLALVFWLVGVYVK